MPSSLLINKLGFKTRLKNIIVEYDKNKKGMWVPVLFLYKSVRIYNKNARVVHN